MERNPMLALPMGKEDFQSGGRWRFLTSCKSVLKELGWTIGVELKGTDFESWIGGLISEIDFYEGRMTYHIPQSATKGLAKGVDDNLANIAKQVRAINNDRNIIEAVTIHCAPAVSIDPPEDAGLERYNSPISAEEMLGHIKSQVEPLKKLNELLGGILHIENVDITNFRDGGTKVPTYLALQTGCWDDLLWLKEQTGVSATFDSEHRFCAHNLLCRIEGFEVLRDYYHENYYREESMSQNVRELNKVTGYQLVKGKAPRATSILLTKKEFVPKLQPNLFHLGGAVRAVDDLNRIDTHLPSLKRSEDILRFELEWIMSNPEAIGAVIEVTGQLDPEKYSEWSPRPADDELAKMNAYLTVINEIETLQLKHYKRREQNNYLVTRTNEHTN